LFGLVSPSGRLPVSWPKSVGQIPIHYNHKNTGRPASKKNYVHIDDIPLKAWQSSLGNNSHYLDDGYEPLYPFGYGLSYSTFDYSDFKVDQSKYSLGDSITVSFNLTNSGDVKAKEVVQLYFQDPFASLTRPVKELVRFKKVSLSPNETKAIQFKLSTSDFAFSHTNGKWFTEAGSFNLWIGPNASIGEKTDFIIE